MTVTALPLIRKAVEALRRQNAFRKEVKFYKVPVRNWELFDELRAAGRLVQTPGGSWTLKE